MAIDVQGKTNDLRIAGNDLRETARAQRRVGIRIAAEAGAIELAGNRIDGFATEVEDRRAKG